MAEVGYCPERAEAAFARRPLAVARRLGAVAGAAASLGLREARGRWLAAPEAWGAGGGGADGGGGVDEAELCGALEALGPTFVKLGQTLSTRADLVGEATAGKLAKLQDAAAPFSTSEAFRILKAELGGTVTNFFADLSFEPVASASFGQVYKCTTLDGREVAVKIQRPGALEAVALDVYLLRRALGVVRRAVGMSRDLGPLADELGRGLYAELDYRREAANCAKFAEVSRRASPNSHSAFGGPPRGLTADAPAARLAAGPRPPALRRGAAARGRADDRPGADAGVGRRPGPPGAGGGDGGGPGGAGGERGAAEAHGGAGGGVLAVPDAGDGRDARGPAPGEPAAHARRAGGWTFQAPTLAHPRRPSGD